MLELQVSRKKNSAGRSYKQTQDPYYKQAEKANEESGETTTVLRTDSISTPGGGFLNKRWTWEC